MVWGGGGGRGARRGGFTQSGTVTVLGLKGLKNRGLDGWKVERVGGKRTDVVGTKGDINVLKVNREIFVSLCLCH